MFQFPGFALLTLCVQVKSTWFSRRSSEAIQDRHRLFAGQVQLLIIEDCQVGCPIRRFRDQRVLSPPPDLSQSATSFIASCCQGIHQTPLSRLIRSRRRQALLREVVQTSTRVPIWSEVSTQRRSLGRGGTVVASPERSSQIRQDPRSVSFDLERLFWLSYRFAA